MLQVFPHMPLNAVIEDLRVTRSVDFTIENILEGRLQAPPVCIEFSMMKYICYTISLKQETIAMENSV